MKSILEKTCNKIIAQHLESKNGLLIINSDIILDDYSKDLSWMRFLYHGNVYVLKRICNTRRLLVDTSNKLKVKEMNHEN